MKPINFKANPTNQKTLKTLNKKSTQAQSALSLILAEFYVNDTFDEASEDIYNVLWNINSLLENAKQTAWSLSINDNQEGINALYQNLAQASGIGALLIRQRDNVGEWAEGNTMLNALANMLDLIKGVRGIINKLSHNNNSTTE